MTRAQQLEHASELTRCLDKKYGVDDATRRERLIKAVYGNLAIERPDLELEQVRRVLSADRPR